MRRLIIFFFLFFLVLSVFSFAQNNATTPAANEQKPAVSQTQPGHPLDPYDVYVLTGKKDEAERQQTYSPSMYYSAPLGASQFPAGNTNSFAGVREFQNFDSRGFVGMTNFNGPFAFGNGSQWNGSQFADVSTLPRRSFRFWRTNETGGRPNFGFGNSTPVFRFAPRRFAPGGGFQRFTGPSF